jgi:superfamily II DNA/RNA helicase
LVCLANLENLNAVFIGEGMAQHERLKKLNQIAIGQMRILLQTDADRALIQGGADE